MSRMPRPALSRRAIRLVLALLWAGAAGHATLASARGQATPPRPAPAARLDVVVLSADGRPETALSATDFKVELDGTPRTVRSARYVFRGPGAGVAARVAGGALAEPSRVILLAVDETSIARGDEKNMQAAVRRALDLVGAVDSAALVTLPVTRGDTSLTTDRQMVRERLAALVGRGVPGNQFATADAPGLRDSDFPLNDDEPDAERQRNVGDVQPGLSRDNLGARGLDPSLAPGDPAARPSSMQALARVLERLGEVPGRKAVILFAGGARAPDTDGAGRSPDPRPELALVLDAAVASRSTIHVIWLDRGRPDRVHELMATSTGGLLVRSGTSRDFDRLTAALTGSYLLEIEARDGDLDGRSHTLAVTASRKPLTIAAAARWAWRDDPLPASVTVDPAPRPGATLLERGAAGSSSTSAASAPAGSPAAGTRVAPKRPVRPDPELEVVLGRVTDYLDGYLADFANVVAEERYDQRVYSGSVASPLATRTLRSDLLLVRVPGPFGWVPFRDVFEVDGRPVRDREERLRKLFLENADAAMLEARRVADEGARYNVGSAFRTLNVPTLPLMFLVPAKLPGFQFTRHGEDTVEGVRAWRIDYEEVARPTIIRRPGTDAEIPASGSFFVDPATGRILRTTVRASVGSLTMVTTVTYRRSDTLGLWAPTEMVESYAQRGETIEGRATYTNFRRFQVSTDVNIAPPKKHAPRPE